MEPRLPDHAHCNVGSYTHGLISLEEAAAGQDTAALVGTGWVTPADLPTSCAARPAAITYSPSRSCIQRSNPAC